MENGKEVVTSDEAYTNALLKFKTDGTCVGNRVEGGYTETSRWPLEDNKLTLSCSDSYSDILTINGFTATKSVLIFENWGNLDDGSLELDDITATTYKGID